jgi:hypothetical protein
MIRSYPERNRQAMASSYTAHGVLGFLISLISTRWKVEWGGDLGLIQGLDWNFKSLQRQDSIHSMTGLIRQCSNFQVHLKIQWRIQWWKRTVIMHCIPVSRVWYMLSGLKTMMLNRMHHTGCSKSPSTGWSEGGLIETWQIGNHLFWYEWSMHTFLIRNELRKSKLI